MDGPASDGELAALRDRLYRPEPPPGAEVDYLAALASRGDPAPAATAPPTPGREPRPGRRRILIAGALALVALSIGAFALGQRPTTGRAVAVSRPSAPPAPEFGAALLPPSVPGIVLAERSSADPPGSIRVDGHHRTIVVTAICADSGTLTISLGSGNGGTVLLCTRAVTVTGMVRSSRPLGAVTVRLSTTDAPRWAVSIGAVPVRSTVHATCSTCREARLP